MPKHSPQRVFVSSLLERCLRLSYLQRIEQALVTTEGAGDLVALLPGDQSAIWPYDEQDAAFSKEAAAIRDLVCLSNKAESERVQAAVDDLLSDLKTDAPSEERARVLVSAVVYEGRESVSHLMGISGRYLSVLRSVMGGEDEQRAACDSVIKVWANCRQNVVLVLDKFVSMKLVSPFALVRWLLASYDDCLDKQDFVWEVLHLTIAKPLALVERVKADLEAAEQEAKEMRERPGDTEEMDLVQEKEERIGKIRAVLKTAREDEEDLMTLVVQKLILCAGECSEKAAKERDDMDNGDDDDLSDRGRGDDSDAGGRSDGDDDDDDDDDGGGRRKRKRAASRFQKGSVHSVWLGIFSGRIHEIGRRYAKLLGSCDEAIQDTIADEEVSEPAIENALAAMRSVYKTLV